MQGHVDAMGEVISLDLLGDNNWWLRLRVPPEIYRYLVFKGSIAIDGRPVAPWSVHAASGGVILTLPPDAHDSPSDAGISAVVRHRLSTPVKLSFRRR